MKTLKIKHIIILCAMYIVHIRIVIYGTTAVFFFFYLINIYNSNVTLIKRSNKLVNIKTTRIQIYVKHINIHRFLNSI